MRGLIVLGGDAPAASLLAERFAWADVVVAADRGLQYAMDSDLLPNIVIGDFDSADVMLAERARMRGCDVRMLPSMKDRTDGQEALDIALALGCDEIALVGGFGGRFDHQFGHICLLVRALRHGAKAWMESLEERIACFEKGVAEIKGNVGDMVSILPFGEGLWVKKVEGLQYPIDNQALPIDYPYGISNVLTSASAFITITAGTAVVTHSLTPPAAG